MTLELSLDAGDAPFALGRARPLGLSVRVRGPEVALLDSVELAAGAGAASFVGGVAHSWKRPQEGVVDYDAKRDRYVHEASLQGTTAVLFHSGVVPPGARAECFVPARFLEAGRRSVAVTVRWRSAPADQLASRLYLPPPGGITGATVIYSLGREAATRVATEPPGLAIVRERDLPLHETKLESTVDVAPDGGAPADGRPLGRVRSLGGAWLLRRADGVLEVRGARTVALPRVELAVFDRLETLVLGDPVLLTFQGEAGAAVRTALGLAEGVQGAIEQEDVLALLEAVARAGARLRPGYSWEGLIVSA